MQISFDSDEFNNQWYGFKLEMKAIIPRIKYALWGLIDPIDFPKAINLVESIEMLPKHKALRAIDYFLAVEFHEYDIEKCKQNSVGLKQEYLDRTISFLECQNKTTLELELMKARLEAE
jgi:hypothetical protein